MTNQHQITYAIENKRYYKVHDVRMTEDFATTRPNLTAADRDNGIIARATITRGINVYTATVYENMETGKVLFIGRSDS